MTDGIIKKVTDYVKRRELRHLKDDLFVDADGVVGSRSELSEYPDELPQPGGQRTFAREIELRTLNNPLEYEKEYFKIGYSSEDLQNIRPVFVSRMPSRKMRGQIHAETIRSARDKERGVAIAKEDIKKLKLDKNNEIAGYYNAGSDSLLYNALKKRLLAFGGDGEKAFQETFYKPKADGTNGNPVKKVKLEKYADKGFDIVKIKGYADNGGMLRIDVFVKDNKYYAVPVYVKDYYKKELPNKACVANTPFSEWPEMDETHEFIFSLYPNDLIEVEHKNGFQLKKTDGSNEQMTVNKAILYYRSFGSAVGSISCTNHDRSFGIESLGIKTLKSLRKMTVDILGNYSYVKKEVRQDFSQDTNPD